MANRSFHRVQSLTRELKILHAKAAVASNVATIVSNDSMGVTSVVISGTGVVTVTLDDKYNKLVHVSAHTVGGSEVDSKFVVTSEDVAGNKTIVLQHVVGAVAANVSDSDVLIKVELKNSSVVR